MILKENTTLPRSINVAQHTTGGGANMIAAPGAGKTITLVDIINADASNVLLLRETGAGGNILARIPAGAAISLNAPIETSANVLVYASGSTAATVTYIVG